jgi:hypothetical protein
LYDLACSPSFQFAYRYFNFLDLEFSKNAIHAVRGFPKKLGRPNYILKIKRRIGETELETLRLRHAVRSRAHRRFLDRSRLSIF